MTSMLTIREMDLSEVGIILDYFYSLSPEHLEKLGIDSARFLSRENWKQFCEHDYAQPIEQRANYRILWLSGNTPVGFSTADTINFGRDAKMHLHVLNPENRNKGIGTKCVRNSVEKYFETLNLKHLYCEPNAFNIAPNRTLQKVGFKFLKTHETIPGSLNFHQVVNRWVFERDFL